MIDIGAGPLLTGGRMIWEGIKWIARSRQAPWSVVNLSADLAATPEFGSWYRARFFCRNEKSFAVELLSVRSIRPADLRLKPTDRGTPSQVRESPGTAVVENLRWLIQEAEIKAPFQRELWVDLSGRSGEIQIDFEFKARFVDSRRTNALIWVRTNPIRIC